MQVDIEKKWLDLYIETPKEEDSWFLGASVFRKKYEFGLTRDWDDFSGYSRYYLYALRFNREGLRADRWEFPRKNRWTHVTG